MSEPPNLVTNLSQNLAPKKMVITQFGKNLSPYYTDLLYGCFHWCLVSTFINFNELWLTFINWRSTFVFFSQYFATKARLSIFYNFKTVFHSGFQINSQTLNSLLIFESPEFMFPREPYKPPLPDFIEFCFITIEISLQIESSSFIQEKSAKTRDFLDVNAINAPSLV